MGGRATRAARRFLGLAGVTVLVAVLLACGAEGHEPGATDLATVSAAVDRLAASDDPRRAFSELPAETRQAVIDYLKVETPDSAWSSGPTTPIGAPEGCERQEAAYTARNAHGRDLWSFLSSTEWCWADGTITTAPVVTTSAEIHAPLWEFAGRVEEHEHESGGQGEATHFQVLVGLFQLCPESSDNCVEDEYAQVIKWQHGNGDHGFDIAPMDYEDPYADETMPDETPPLVGIVYTLLIVVPICAAAFIVGWVVRRSGARGSLVWGLGVIVTAWGASLALEHGLRALIFESRLFGFAELSFIGLYFPLTHALPPVAAALGAGWIMWKAAQRGSVIWGLGVVGLAFGTFSVLRGLASVLIFLPGSLGSFGGPVVTTEVVTEEIPVEVFDAHAKARDQFRIEDGECERHKRGIEGRNLFGQKLWTLQSDTRWCWNGTAVGKDPSISPAFNAYSETHVPFWRSSFSANSSSHDWDLPWELSDRASETFYVCLPLLACVQNEFAVIEKRQFSDGTAIVDYPSLTEPSQRYLMHPALTLVPLIPMSAVALVTGRVLLRRSRRGSASWGVGVIATGLGVLVPVLGVIVGLFFLTTSYTLA